MAAGSINFGANGRRATNLRRVHAKLMPTKPHNIIKKGWLVVVADSIPKGTNKLYILADTNTDIRYLIKQAREVIDFDPSR